MIKTLIRILICVVIFLGVLWIGGSSWNDFKRGTQMKDPAEVYDPVIEKLPDLDIPDMNNPEDVITTADHSDKVDNDTTESTTDDGIGTIEYNTENTTIDDTTIDDNTEVADNNTEITTESTTQKDAKAKVSLDTIITIDDKSIDMSKHITLDILDWLAINYHTGVNISFKHKNVENNTTQTIANANFTEEQIYDDKLETKEELECLISTINVVKELPKYEDYDRTTYEKPVKSYKLNGHSINRNDYAWKTSKWFDGEAFTYMCPYTGTIIKDSDDKKDDYDFGNLDYDHIVPLKSTYLRGAKEWSAEKQNEYAYDQWVGVDVLNSANRSKSDKGPTEYLPDINIEDYCFSWLLICSKYGLSMTEDEIQVCRDNIEIALENGDEITHLGGFYDESKQ